MMISLWNTTARQAKSGPSQSRPVLWKCAVSGGMFEKKIGLLILLGSFSRCFSASEDMDGTDFSSDVYGDLTQMKYHTNVYIGSRNCDKDQAGLVQERTNLSGRCVNFPTSARLRLAQQTRGR